MNKLPFLLFLLLVSCSAQSSKAIVDNEPDWSLHSVKLSAYPKADIRIDNGSKIVSIELPYGEKLGESTIEIVPAGGISTTPKTGEKVNLNNFKTIYLSAEGGKAARFGVTVTVLPSSSTAFSTLTEDNYRVKAWSAEGNFSFRFPHGADLKHLSFTTDAKEGLHFNPDIKDIDLTSAREVTVTAPDGKTNRKIYLEADHFPQDAGVRGVYLPSPNHTGSFLSYSEICKSMDLLSNLHFNCLFVCAWAGSRVAWDSQVLLENSTWTTRAAGNMYASYTGGSGDALKDIIEVAHSRGIKVILWFEYGFMHGIGGVNTTDPVLARHPEWIGINSNGAPCNYNDTDFYLNGYDPEVQDFMMNLMKEALELYPEVDGIQGDDRLPAMPHNAGYDEKTKAKYLAETGKAVPTNDNDSDWERWRLNELNAFAKRMHTELKAIKPSLVVCFAPNKYPWCQNVLMQEWPQWISDGAVDLLTVQCYVIAKYKEDVSATLGYVKERTDAPLFNPAMILKNGDTVLSVDKLAEQLQFNREVGTFGESQFWFDGLKDPAVQELFKLYYPTPLAFPEL